MDTNELAHVIEAILFVAGEPVNVKDVQRALDVTEDETRRAIDALDSDYSFHRRGITLKRFGEHIQLSTRAEYAPYVERLLQPIQKQSLSQSALETLAIVAYRQPVTRGVIEQIRGVDSAYTLTNLLEKGILEECGRLDVPGRPILYRTSEAFLRIFGLSSLRDLPPLPEEMTDAQLTMFSDAEEEPNET